MSFRDEVEKGLGAVVILAGSNSDFQHIKKIADELKRYGIPFDARIASGHKQDAEVHEIMRQYDFMRGPLAYIAVAGMTDALSGIMSYHSTKSPVISCPPDAPNATCLTNPPMSSNATIYQPSNVAKFVAQMFAHLNPAYSEAIRSANAKKETELRAADSELLAKLEQPQEAKK
jgi:phosphoribosylaminoimidazole carboxylase PurE protein